MSVLKMRIRGIGCLLFVCVAAAVCSGGSALEVRGSSTYAQRVGMTEMALLGAAADGGDLPGNYAPLPIGAVPPEFQAGYDPGTGLYTDASTGLSVLLARNTDTGEVAIAFGGSEIAEGGLGDAASKAGALVSGVVNSAGAGSTVNITGNSPLGGGLAQYAMLQNEEAGQASNVAVNGYGFNMGELTDFDAFLAAFPGLEGAIAKLPYGGKYFLNHFESDGDLIELVNRIMDMNRYGDDDGSYAFWDTGRVVGTGIGNFRPDPLDMNDLYEAMVDQHDRQESLRDELDRIKNDWGDFDDDNLLGGVWSDNALVDLGSVTPGDTPGGTRTPGSVVQGLIDKNYSATYRGSVVAQGSSSYWGGTPEGGVSGGTFLMSANFGARTFSSNITIDSTPRYGSIQMNTNGGLTASDFSGTNVGGAGITSSNGSQFQEGGLRGEFYGPGAEGVGGGFQIMGPDGGGVNGSFAGKR